MACSLTAEAPEGNAWINERNQKKIDEWSTIGGGGGRNYIGDAPFIREIHEQNSWATIVNTHIPMHSTDFSVCLSLIWFPWFCPNPNCVQCSVMIQWLSNTISPVIWLYSPIIFYLIHYIHQKGQKIQWNVCLIMGPNWSNTYIPHRKHIWLRPFTCMGPVI